MNTTLQILPEKLRWRSREVRYYAGAWSEVLSVRPEFETVPFRAGPGERSNPFLLAVSRKPLSAVERPMPVGVCPIVTRSSSTVTWRCGAAKG